MPVGAPYAAPRRKVSSNSSARPWSPVRTSSAASWPAIVYSPTASRHAPAQSTLALPPAVPAARRWNRGSPTHTENSAPSGDCKRHTTHRRSNGAWSRAWPVCGGRFSAHITNDLAACDWKEPFLEASRRVVLTIERAVYNAEERLCDQTFGCPLG